MRGSFWLLVAGSYLLLCSYLLLPLGLPPHYFLLPFAALVCDVEGDDEGVGDGVLARGGARGRYGDGVRAGGRSEEEDVWTAGCGGKS